jgi:hypothetical protein
MLLGFSGSVPLFWTSVWVQLLVLELQNGVKSIVLLDLLLNGDGYQTKQGQYIHILQKYFRFPKDQYH